MMPAEKRGLRALAGVGLLTALCVAWATGASAGALERVRQDKVIRLAYREDAPPFSFKDNIGEPAGYMVDLCRAVAKDLAKQQQIENLSVAYVPVTALNRFDAIQEDKADILCEPTSATLSRRKLVDFSIATYVDGASLMIRADGPRDLKSLSGLKIGVLGATTTERELRNTLKAQGIDANVIVAKTHAEGLTLMDDGTISAYFADRDILMSLIKNSKAPEKLAVAENYLTIEPYALALPRGDEEFRLAVDEAISHIYRSGQIGAIYTRNFNATTKPSGLLSALFLISGLPD